MGRLTLAAVVGAAFLLLLASATALADGSGGPKPTIESWSASHITATDATLEALVNPGTGEDGFALETTYEFFLESPWCGSGHLYGGCEASGGVLVYKGTIAGGATAPQLESVDLAGVGQKLSADTTYGYRVVARNEVGEAFGFEKTFTTAAEGKAPVIEGVSASHITQDDATLEAQVNPEGLETTYELSMEDPCRSPMECIRVPLLASGTIPATTTSESLSIDLASSGEHLNIEPGMTYGYWVIAKNAAGTTEVQKTFTTPPAGTAPTAPVIESVSVSNLTPTEATLEAQIDTEGQSTSYEFLLSYDPCPECEDLETVRIDLPSGLLLPSFQDQSVSLDLASVGVTLRHGGEYEYSLRAINASGKTEARTQTFRAPPPPPIVEPLGSATSPGPSGSTSSTSNDGSQPAGSGNSSPTTPGTASALGISSKTGAGTTAGKPKAKHGKHHNHKHHGTKAAKHSAKSKKQKR